jgi:hypothetical protein
MKIDRPHFEEAVGHFRDFLKSQDCPENILWLSRDRLTGHRNTIWIFRPEDLTSTDNSKNFYETIRQTPGSIRIDALGRVGGHTLAYVENWGGDSSMLNFGILESPIKIKIVSSQLFWAMLRFLNGMRGESPLLKNTEITKSAEPRHPPDR